MDRNPFGGLVGIPAEGQGYQPVDGDSFLCRNGKQAFNYTITQGVSWEIGKAVGPFASRLRRLDLTPYFNADMTLP